MVTSALAIKENFTIKSQNRVLSYGSDILGNNCYYGCNFRLGIVLLNTWVFWVLSGLDATILKTCLLEASNFYLTFYKTRQLATWLKVSPKCQTGFQAYSSKRKRFILSIETPIIPPPATTNWVCYNKMADQEIEILIIQGSDLGLGTQEYFQFSVSFLSWGSPMPHFDRKLSQS